MAVIRLNDNEKKEPVEIVVHAGNPLPSKTGGTFTPYKVEKDGKLVDLRWKKDVDQKEFEGLRKFKVTVEDYSYTEKYIYPRVYAGGIVGDIVEVR